jgi:hypothetical protein
MWRKLFSIALVVLLLQASDSLLIRKVGACQGGTVGDKVKAFVAKRGTGPKAKVTVKLKDNTKLKGYISGAGDDSFTLADSKSGQLRTLAYQDVAEVKRPGGLSWPAKVGIGIGIGVGVLAILYGIACHDDPFC